jgi:hypothetical protein
MEFAASVISKDVDLFLNSEAPSITSLALVVDTTRMPCPAPRGYVPPYYALVDDASDGRGRPWGTYGVRPGGGRAPARHKDNSDTNPETVETIEWDPPGHADRGKVLLLWGKPLYRSLRSHKSPYFQLMGAVKGPRADAALYHEHCVESGNFTHRPHDLTLPDAHAMAIRPPNHNIRYDAGHCFQSVIFDHQLNQFRAFHEVEQCTRVLSLPFRLIFALLYRTEDTCPHTFQMRLSNIGRGVWRRRKMNSLLQTLLTKLQSSGCVRCSLKERRPRYYGTCGSLLPDTLYPRRCHAYYGISNHGTIMSDRNRTKHRKNRKDATQIRPHSCLF